LCGNTARNGWGLNGVYSTEDEGRRETRNGVFKKKKYKMGYLAQRHERSRTSKGGGPAEAEGALKTHIKKFPFASEGVKKTRVGSAWL